MKHRHYIGALLVGCGIFWSAPEIVFAAVDDTSPAVTRDRAAPETNEDIAEEIAPPGLAIFALLMVVIILVICLILVGIGIVAAIAALGLAAVLVAVGVVSSSLLIGLIRRRLDTGFRALFIQLGAIAGVLCGITTSWLVVWLCDLEVGFKWTALLGAACGLVSGSGIALLFNLAWGRTVRWMVARYDRLSETQPRTVATDA